MQACNFWPHLLSPFLFLIFGVFLALDLAETWHILWRVELSRVKQLCLMSWTWRGETILGGGGKYWEKTYLEGYARFACKFFLPCIPTLFIESVPLRNSQRPNLWLRLKLTSLPMFSVFKKEVCSHLSSETANFKFSKSNVIPLFSTFLLGESDIYLAYILWEFDVDNQFHGIK